LVHARWIGYASQPATLEDGFGDAAWIITTQYRHQLCPITDSASVAAATRVGGLECRDRGLHHDVRDYARSDSSFCILARGVIYLGVSSSLVKVQGPTSFLLLVVSSWYLYERPCKWLESINPKKQAS
jgi:hypothetical protein